MKPRPDKNYQFKKKKGVGEWLSISEQAERNRQEREARESALLFSQHRGGEEDVFMPLAPPSPRVKEEEASEVNSDDEDKEFRRNIVMQNRDQLLQAPQHPQHYQQPPPQQKDLLCGVCGKTLCPLSGLIRVHPHEIWGTETPHPPHPQECRGELGGGAVELMVEDGEGTAIFEGTKCFGYVFAKDDVATCRDGHPFGFSVAGRKYVDKNSRVAVGLAGGERREWCPLLWQNDFEAIGGPCVEVTAAASPMNAAPSLSIIEPSQDDHHSRNRDQGYFCQICHVKSKTKKAFLSHLASRKHKEEEEYLLSQ